MPRPGRPQLTQATRSALFIFKAAGDAGFQFRDAGAGLEVLGPPASISPPVKAPSRRSKLTPTMILRFVRWLDGPKPTKGGFGRDSPS